MLHGSCGPRPKFVLSGMVYDMKTAPLPFKGKAACCYTCSLCRSIQLSFPRTPAWPGVGIMEADDRQVTTVFTVQPSFHHRHSINRLSWSVTIVGERAVTPHLVVRRRWKLFMILGLSSAHGGMTVGLWRTVVTWRSSAFMIPASGQLHGSLRSRR